MNFLIKCFVIISIFLPLFTIGCSGNSSETDFPQSCVAESYEFNGKSLVLNESHTKQNLYLFHNISDKNLWLNHPISKDPGASAGWASELNTRNWSALAINVAAFNMGNFEITCSIMDENGKINYLDCRDIIKTCKVKEPTFNSENSGSFWVAENKPLSNLLDSIKSRGISW